MEKKEIKNNSPVMVDIQTGTLVVRGVRTVIGSGRPIVGADYSDADSCEKWAQWNGQEAVEAAQQH